MTYLPVVRATGGNAGTRLKSLGILGEGRIGRLRPFSRRRCNLDDDRGLMHKRLVINFVCLY